MVELDVERGAGRYVDRPAFASFYEALQKQDQAGGTRSAFSAKRAEYNDGSISLTHPAASSRQERDRQELRRAAPTAVAPEALIEADRCYFCYDAPCTTACPTGIDIPSFIQKIRSDNIRGSAQTILQGKHHGRHVRACLSHRSALRASVRQEHPRRKTG